MNKTRNNDVNYFLISVSNKENLELCIKHAMAGFTNSINGLWTFLDIKEGDYISFLYGARVKNLYRVIKKVAYRNSENLPPWPQITFRSGKTYYFPFRLLLKQEREFDEPMVRAEFSYIAENLLLRGGYRKTHFQADTVTFYNVSHMGKPSDEKNIMRKPYDEKNEIKRLFVPKLVFRKELQKIPEKFYFHELILQSLVKRKIKSILTDILDYFRVKNSPDEFEILGEKALPEGYVDIFIKLKHPVAENRYLLVEVKKGCANNKDLDQLRNYIKEFGPESIGGILIANKFSKSISYDAEIKLIKYFFEGLEESNEYTYEELLNLLKIEIVK